MTLQKNKDSPQEDAYPSSGFGKFDGKSDEPMVSTASTPEGTSVVLNQKGKYTKYTKYTKEKEVTVARTFKITVSQDEWLQAFAERNGWTISQAGRHVFKRAMECNHLPVLKELSKFKADESDPVNDQIKAAINPKFDLDAYIASIKETVYNGEFDKIYERPQIAIGKIDAELQKTRDEGRKRSLLDDRIWLSKVVKNCHDYEVYDEVFKEFEGRRKK